MDAVKTLEDIRIQDHSFPHEILVGCETALVLFCAAFLGRQDAFWINEAGLVGTCVDTDEKKLDEMWMLYPDSWEFVAMDAYEFAASSGRQWDVVTLDPFTNEFTRCADNLEGWCRLAKHAVIMGTGIGTVVSPPPGWRQADHRHRTTHDGGVYWTVLERV